MPTSDRTADRTAVVIGAGLAGLAAARRLSQAGFRVTVLEQNRCAGGRVRSDEVQGVGVEAGAHFLTRSYTNTLSLIRECGLQAQEVKVPSEVALMRDGRLLTIGPALRTLGTPLISTRSKLRLARLAWAMLVHFRELDMHAFHKAAGLDVRSAAAYAQATLNREILDYVVEPALSGVFYWTPERTSQAILILFAKATIERAGSGTRLLSLRGGLGELPRVLASGLDVRFAARVTRVEREPSGRYRVEANVDGQGEVFTTSRLVCAVPGTQVPYLFPDAGEAQAEFFRGVAYSSTVIATVGIRGRLPTELYSLYFPRSENLPHLAAAVIGSPGNAGRNRPGNDLLSLYASGVAGRALLDQSDAVVAERLLGDAGRVPALRFPPQDQLFCRICRWPEALPEFPAGYLKRLASFIGGGAGSGRLAFAGDYIGGPFIEGAVTSGLAAAERLLAAA